MFLVTNWHNVTGVDPFTGSNLSNKGGRPNRVIANFVEKAQIGNKIEARINLRKGDQAIWLVHPDLGNQVDAVAIEMPRADNVDWFCINELENEKSQLSCDVGQDVFILGYPFGYGPHGFPVWKRGSIASEPNLILPTQQYMLVDSASRPGMSGSPVIRRSWGHHVMKGGGTISGPGAMTTFLGIYSGRLKTADPLDAQLGLVWRADLVREIVYGGVKDTF